MNEVGFFPGFNETECSFKMEFGGTDLPFNLEFDEQGGSVDKDEYYNGAYTVTPKVKAETILKTRGYKMADNVTVKEVPYHEIANDSGGVTVYIGMEVE